MERGVLLHISSLPGEYGIGSFGEAAYRFVDLVRKSRLTLWQVLPLNVTSYGDSPYQSPSAFAGNPYFIDLDFLVRDGLLTNEELPHYPAGAVDYAALYDERWDTLRKAFARFAGGEEYDDFCASAKWLDDYALFMTVKSLCGNVGLDAWPDEYRLRDKAALEKVRREQRDELEFHRFTQYLFFTQWRKLKAYANANGVRIVGDMPIYVAYDSADVWCHPDLFLLDDRLIPTVVAGVPPDCFSATGQLWGNPIYDWDAMRADGYRWWIERLNAAGALFDIVRIDHFRGFESFYTIPYGRPDACVGEWVKGPGMALFDVLQASCDTAVIAEDLGLLDDDVRAMVRATGYPSMKVLEFGLDGESTNEYLPHNYPVNCIAYTGTHDNDTALGWFNALPASRRRRVRLRTRRLFGSPVPGMIRMLFRSRAKYVVIPMQDFLNLDSAARMNTPSTLGGNNWRWRLTILPETIEYRT